MIESYMGPTAPFAGSSAERQSVGLPGHCVKCAEHGHVAAHPDLGCGDVGCTARHDESTRNHALPGPLFEMTVDQDGNLHTYSRPQERGV